MLKFLHQAYFKRALLISTLIVLIYSFILTPLGWFDVARLKAQDVFSAIARQIKPAPNELKDIVLLSIDDQSFKVLNKRWPWGRDIIAEMLQILKDYEPLLVCPDFVFGGASENKEHDILLANALEDAGNVLLPSYYGKKAEYVSPHRPLLEAALATGVINIPKDKDSYIRNVRPIILSKTHQAIEYSLGVKAACRYFDIPLENISYDGEKIIFKRARRAKRPTSDIHIPVRKDGTMPLSFGANFDEFNVIPLWKVFTKEVPKEVLENKIVLVGQTSEVFHDIHNTPLGSLPGTAIIAYDIMMLISGNFVQELPRPLELLVLFVFALLAAVTTYFLSTYKGLISVIFELALFAAASIIISLRSWRWDFFSVAFIVILIYVAINFYKYIRLVIESAKLKTLAITDELTGLYTYRYFRIRLQNELERAARYGHHLCLIMLDIDHFKSLNDTYGHEKGNVVLKALAEVIQSFTRKTDIVFRYGGEEFCVILSQSNQSGAVIYAERLRKEIENHEILLGAGSPLKTSVSIGVASATDDLKSLNELVERADQALYKAKMAGRNRVCEFQQAQKK